MLKVESFGVIPLVRAQGTWQVLLILHRKGNHWGFPKGKANPLENPLQTATRELLEETGLSIVNVFGQNPLIEQYQFRRKKQLIIKTVHYFPALVTGDLKLQEEEIRACKWVTIPEALQQLSFKEARHILQECLRMLDKNDV